MPQETDRYVVKTEKINWNSVCSLLQHTRLQLSERVRPAWLWGAGTWGARFLLLWRRRGLAHSPGFGPPAWACVAPGWVRCPAQRPRGNMISESTMELDCSRTVTFLVARGLAGAVGLALGLSVVPCCWWEEQDTRAYWDQCRVSRDPELQEGPGPLPWRGKPSWAAWEEDCQGSEDPGAALCLKLSVKSEICHRRKISLF